MGVETLAICALAAGAIATGASAVSASTNNRRTIEAQEDMYKKQREDQLEDYEQRTGVNAQAQQYRDIGVNPASMLAGGSSGFSSQSMPSVPSLSGFPSLENVGSAATQNLSQMISAVGNIQSYKERDSTIQKIMAERDGQEFANNMMEIQTKLLEKYGDKHWASKIDNLLADSYLKKAQGDYDGALTSYQGLLHLIASDEVEMKHIEKAMFADKLSQSIKLMKSQETANYASATQSKAYSSYLKALEATENALRSERVENMSLANDLSTIDKFIKGNDLTVSDSTVQARVFGIVEQMYQQGIISENLYKQGQLLSTKMDWAGRQEFADYLSKIVGSASDVMNSYTNYMGASWNNQNTKVRNEIQGRIATEFERKGKEATSARRNAVLGPDYEMYAPQWQQ